MVSQSSKVLPDHRCTTTTGRFPLLLLFAAALPPVFGCSSEPVFNYAHVSGKVTLDGQPVPGASILFTPKGNGKSAITGEFSMATTDQEGRFTLKAASGTDGAIIDVHEVAIFPGRGGDDSEPTVRPVNPVRIPRKYHDGKALTFQVPSGGTDVANFSLEGGK